MQDRATRVASLAAVVLCFGLFSSPSVACPVTRGAHLVLVSNDLDPDVFLWDSADRLVKYAMGDYNVETVLKHTTLVRAYSRAVALGCKNPAIHPSYTGATSDATVFVVGVRVAAVRGSSRNGWVLSTDIRGPNGQELTVGRHRH
jgi:hypothetical protein